VWDYNGKRVGYKDGKRGGYKEKEGESVREQSQSKKRNQKPSGWDVWLCVGVSVLSAEYM